MSRARRPVRLSLSNQPDDDVARLRRELFAWGNSVDLQLVEAAGCCHEHDPSGEVDGWIKATDFGVQAGFEDAGPAITSLLEGVSQGNHGKARSVYIGPGDYNIATAVQHPENVRVWGAGATTRFYQPFGASNTVWVFAGVDTSNLRSELGFCQMHGAARSDITDLSIRTGIGVDVADVQAVTLHDLQVNDFATGVRVSRAGATSEDHTIGPRVDVARADVGVSCIDSATSVRVVGCKISDCYTDVDDGLGIDISDPGGLQVVGCNFAGADTCVRVRSVTGIFNASISDSTLVPGTNPDTSTVGTDWDVILADVGDGLATWRESGCVTSSNGDVSLPPEGFMHTDGASLAAHGARFDGASVPRRNYVYNGVLDMWAYPDALPGWAAGGSAPTVVVNAADFVTGSRSMDITALVVGSTFIASFDVTDPGVEWITFGVRYRVPVGNNGFYFTAAIGANSESSPIADDADAWRVWWINVPVDATDRAATVTLFPDSVGGSGAVRIDEVFAVAGRFAMPSTQYGERIKLITSPIPIISGSTAVATTWGPIDITGLPSVLAGALITFSAPPPGVVGAIVRLRIETDDGSGTGALTFPFSHYIDIPATGATTIAADVQRVVPTFSTLPEETTVVIRDLALTGGITVGTAGYTTDYEVDLIGWVLA